MTHARRLTFPVPLLVLWAGALLGQAPVHATEHRGALPGQPYERFATTDDHGRRIDFYLSERGADASPRPLVVYVHGSGATSHFTERGGRLIPRNGHIGVLEALGDRGRLLIVEKPGVRLGDDPRAPDERAGSETFRREHTLERWADAVGAAIRAARRLPGICDDRTLVIGHSEGGIVACRVARLHADAVTHVATLAGGGPTQLFSLIALARSGAFFGHVSDDPETRAQHVRDEWARILADPLSTEKRFLGFVYRRWSSFLGRSPAEELEGVTIPIYVAQGLDDRAVDPASADMLHATLLARGQDVRYDRVAGAGHSFEDTTGRDDADGWRSQMGRIIAWSLDDDPATSTEP
jgi:pimeloyl-ACP methyl ester carboxylesterase